LSQLQVETLTVHSGVAGILNGLNAAVEPRGSRLTFCRFVNITSPEAELKDSGAEAQRPSGTAAQRVSHRKTTMWVWINTYENTIFSGMNIHLPAILM